MEFQYSLTVPANTPREAPARAWMPVGPGTLHTIEIGFPPGCAGLVHVYVMHWEQQLWPWNTDEAYAWDDYNVWLPNLNFEITAEPYLFSLCGWSEDDSYPHTVVCRLGIAVPAEAYERTWVSEMLGLTPPE